MSGEFQTLNLWGSEIHVGDEFPSLWFMQGGPGVVKAVSPYRDWPYSGTLLKELGEGTQIASFVGTNLQMTLPAKTWYEIRRRSA